MDKPTIQPPLTGRGGKRPGAGRPKGSINKDNGTRLALKRKWLGRVNKIADKIFDAHEDSALGHYREVQTPDGKVKVYKKPPNPMSLEWMMEHIWGKAPQKLEIEADIETKLVITPETEAALAAAIFYAIPRPQQPSKPISEPGTSMETDTARPTLPKGTDAP